MMTFDDAVREVRKVAGPGRVTVVTYAGLKFARDCGIDIIEDFGATLCCQRLIRDVGTEEEKRRLRKMKVGFLW